VVFFKLIDCQVKQPPFLAVVLFLKYLKGTSKSLSIIDEICGTALFALHLRTFRNALNLSL